MTLPITAIVPVRNGASHLRGALASAAEATVAETIVIDGGSTDGSIEIAEAFGGVRTLHQRSRGLAAARNEAIAEATQPFIAFCDSDDRWEPGAAAELHEALVPAPECLAAIGMVLPIAIEDHRTTAAQASRIGVPLPGFTPGAMLARREAFEAIGRFDESLSIGADSEWFVRLVQSGQGPLRLDRVVLRKGLRATSLSADVERYRRELLVIAARYVARRRSGSP
ncbi:MAG: glycosyltransferase family 2 protein [Phycisphaerales bacterium]